MKKQLLRSLALIGGIACALTASAEKRYLQVTSEYQLQTGGQYVIGLVGQNATAWQPVNPLCYTLSDDNAQINFVSKPALDFTDKMVWTATVNTAYTCANPHTSTNPVIDLGMGHKVLQLAQSSNALCFTGAAPSVGVVSAASSNIEFVPCTSTIGDIENDYVFQLHVNPSSTTHFQNICGISSTGVAGAFTSRNDNAGTWIFNDLFNGKNPLSGIYYSSLHRVYLVINSEDLSIAANALWKGFQEEEVEGKGESYAAKVNALEVPDLSSYSANTIETELKKAFKQAVFSLDADLITTLSAAHVNRSGSGTYTSCLTGNDGCYVKMTSTSPTDPNNRPNNMTLSNGKFACYSGNGIAAEDNDYHSLYTVESFYPTYTVAGISFTASTSGAEEKIIIDGVTTPLTSEEQTFVCDGSFIIKGKNQAVLISDITVKLAETATSTTAPTETGWYEITLLKGVIFDNSASNAFSSINGVNKKITNVNDEYKQSNTNFYALKLADDNNDKPASTFIRFVKEGNAVKAQSANGHFVMANGLSARQQSQANAIPVASKDNHTYLLGSFWTYWNSGGAETPYVGASGLGTFNVTQWAVYRVNPAETYDIWSVTITGAPNATEIGNDVRVQCTSNANKGIAKVYNNGTFFITRGTNLTENDFVADDDPADELTPFVTVNNTAKTVNVEYLNKEAYLAKYNELVNNFYAPYAAQSIYDAGMVEKAQNDYCSQIEEAAGEDNILNAEEVAAVKTAWANNPFAADAIKFNKSLDGKFVQFRNLQHNTLYLADDNTPRAAGVTDRTALNTIWQLVLADEATGAMYLKNYADNKMIQNVTANETNVPMSETEGHPFLLEPYVINRNNTDNAVFGIKDTQTGNHNHYLHQVTNTGNRIVKWAYPVSSNASGWIATLADCEDAAAEISAEVMNEPNGRGWVMTLSHADGLSLHSTYNEELHAIKVTRKQAVSRSEDSYTIIPGMMQHNTTDNTVSFALNDDSNLQPNADYDVEIPLAAVKVGTGKYSKPLTASIHVDENGVVTGINEVKNAAVNAPAAIFDLQGRRLSKPAKGINIINGRKVLVK